MKARDLATVTAVYALLTVAMAYPYSVRPGSSILDDAPDIYLYIWTLGWDVHALVHQPWAIFDANIYHPFPNTLAYSESLIGTSFLAAPVIWLTGNLVLAMNLAALATCVLCGTGAFILGRSLGFGAGGAFLCGLIYAFASPRFIKMGQAHMNAVQWIPFALAYLHAYFDRGRRADLRKALSSTSSTRRRRSIKRCLPGPSARRSATTPRHICSPGCSCCSWPGWHSCPTRRRRSRSRTRRSGRASKAVWSRSTAHSQS